MFLLEHDHRFAPKWPSLLRHFPHLTELAIQCGEIPQDPSALLGAPLLRELDLSINSSLMVFLNALSQSPSHFVHLAVLKINDPVGDIDFDSISRLKTLSSVTELNLNSPRYLGSTQDFVPPNLVSLSYFAQEIGTMDFNLPRSLEYFQSWDATISQPGDFADLPSGLRTFSFYSNVTSYGASDVAKLPRSLNYLDLALDDFTSELLAALPPRLQSLHSSFGTQVPSDLLKHLPQTLTSTNVIEPVTVETVDSVPPNIIFLTLATNDLKIFAKLPSKLRELECVGQPLGLYENDGPISLPSTLVHISKLPAELLDHVTLPDGLKSLYVANSVFTAAHALRLPQSLTIFATVEYELESFANLPRGLASLTAEKPSSKGVIAGDHLRSLPPSLTSLTIAAKRLKSAHTLSLFPSTLVTLYLTLDHLKVRSAKHLRTFRLSILTLHLKTDSAGLGDAILTHLPRTLQYLHYIVKEPQFDDISLDSLQALPPMLLNLTLPHSSAIAALSVVPSCCPRKLNISSGNSWIPARS